MTAINLVPPEVLRERAVRARLRTWATRLAAMLLALLVLHAGLSRFAAGSDREYRQWNGRYVALRGAVGSAEALVQERDALLARRGAIRTISAGEPTALLLDLLGRALTPASHVTFLSIERCPPAGGEKDQARGACRGALRLRGKASGHREVGEIIRALRESGAFREVLLIGVSEPMAAEAAGGVEFEVVCNLAAD